MDTPHEKFAHIKGWGADLDPANRPAYPKERTPPRLDPPVRWQEPPAQTRYVEGATVELLDERLEPSRTRTHPQRRIA